MYISEIRTKAPADEKNAVRAEILRYIGKIKNPI